MKLSESQLRKLVKGTLAEIGVAPDSSSSSSSPIDQVKTGFEELELLVLNRMKRDPGGKQQIYASIIELKKQIVDELEKQKHIIDNLEKQIIDNLGVYDSGDDF